MPSHAFGWRNPEYRDDRRRQRMITARPRWRIVTPATDPVCGMKVDPATARHRVRARRATLPLLLRRLPREVRRRPGRYLTETTPRLRRRRQAARSTPARCTPRSARTAPAVARSAGWRWSRSNRRRRRRRPNPELLDMSRRFWIGARARPSRSSRWRWAPHSGAGLHAEAAPCSLLQFASPRRSCCGPAGRSSSAAGHSLVHRSLNMFTPDRPRHRRGLALQRGRHVRARPVPRRLPRPRRQRRGLFRGRRGHHGPGAARARCSNCGRASRPAAPSARCSTSRPRPPAA